MPEHCARCDAAIPLLDGAPAAFCANCGLPQLRISLEFSEEERAAVVAAAQSSQRPTSSGLLDWPLALRIAAVAAVLGLLPCALLPGALLYGMAGIFALLILPLCTLASGAVYQRQRPQREFTVAMGARMGAALSVLLAGLVLLATGITGFAARYAGHSRALEQVMETSIAQAIARAQASGSPMPPELMTVLGWAEVRSGFFVGFQVVEALLLIAAGALCGALAGALLHTRWRRAQQD